MARQRRIHPRQTESRLRWLRAVDADMAAKYPRGRTRYDCMQLGWTEWAWRMKETGEMVSEDKARSFGPDKWSRIEIAGERLTDLGRQVLADRSPAVTVENAKTDRRG